VNALAQASAFAVCRGGKMLSCSLHEVEESGCMLRSRCRHAPSIAKRAEPSEGSAVRLSSASTLRSRSGPQLRSINAERSLLSMRRDSAAPALARRRGDDARRALEAGDLRVVAAFRYLALSSMTPPCWACSTS
jgi:hypothetical protein